MRFIDKILTICFVLLCPLAHAQEETPSKFSLEAYGGLGYGIVVNEGAMDYNLNSNQGELLINYSLTQNLYIQTGVGYNQLSGSGMYAEGSFYHERDLLKIPLMLSYNFRTIDKFRLIGSLGGFGQTIIKDDYQFLNGTQSNGFQGWSFGLQVSASFVYQLNSNLGLGIKFNGQSDVTSHEPNQSQFFEGTQRLNNLSSLGLVFTCGF